MSRKHARLFRVGEEWRIEDLGSRNGTLLDGNEVRSAQPIQPGTEISLSSSMVRVEDTEKPVAWPMESQAATGDHAIFREASELLRSQSSIPASETDSVEVLHSHAERLQVLNDVHQVLAQSLTLEDLMETLLSRAFDLLRPEEAVIVLTQPDGGYRRAARKAAPGYEEEHLLSATLIDEVAQKGKAALVLDVAKDDRFAQAESIVASGVRSLIAAPLADGEGSLGMIALNSRLHRHQFTESDMELLTSLGAVAALRLRNLSLAEEAVERRRLEHEVKLARNIQVTLLPDKLPDLPGYEVRGGTVPSQGVSGDFYEVLQRDGESIIVVADVSGKGISASLLTASLEALLVGPVEAGDAPDVITGKVSHRLFSRTPAAKYATAIVAALELETGKLTYSNAGHNPGLVIRTDGSVEQLDACGPPIGLLPEPLYSQRAVDLAVDDVVILYTDGITEAEDPDEEEFGLERLRDRCVELRHAPLAEMADGVNKLLKEFARGVPFADDRTLVMLRRTATD